MNRYLLFLLAFMLFSAILSAQDNHMDLITSITGAHDGAHMGFTSTTLDWNGDGYDDLVLSSMWLPPELVGVPNVAPYGRVDVYFGGPNFSNVPGISFLGHYPREYQGILSICNAGDMNGDGIDELALFKNTMYEDNNDQHRNLQLCVYYGGANPDTVADYVVTLPYQDWDNGFGIVSSLGDINHDGYSDLGYIIRPNLLRWSLYQFRVIYGDTMQNTELTNAGRMSACPSFIGVGDINADGIDDFTIGYLNTIISGDDYYYRSVLYIVD